MKIERRELRSLAAALILALGLLLLQLQPVLAADEEETAAEQAAGYTITEIEHPYTSIIEDEQVPLDAWAGTWALVNLLLTVGIVLAAIWMAASHIISRKYYPGRTETGPGSRKVPRVVGVLWAAASVVVFIITEDMSRTMVAVDRFTWMAAGLFLMQMVILWFSRSARTHLGQAS